MNSMDLADLRDLMVEFIGADPATDFADDAFVDEPFDDLGFDSLARVELAEQLKERTGLPLPDDLVDQAGTAGELLRRINDALTAASAAGRS